jgi:hypothetical protein
MNDFRNLYSTLLIFSKEELVVIATILGIIIANQLTVEEQAVMGSFFTLLADTILLMASQQALIQAAIDEQKNFINKKEEDKEKELAKKEIDSIKQQLKKLEEKIMPSKK